MKSSDPTDIEDIDRAIDGEDEIREACRHDVGGVPGSSGCNGRSISDTRTPSLTISSSVIVAGHLELSALRHGRLPLVEDAADEIVWVALGQRGAAQCSAANLSHGADA
jgi:hypothetical protein